MQGNQGNSRLLVVKSQFINLTFGPSFGHNLCLKCPKPILYIDNTKAFQSYKELHDLMGFNPYNRSLNIWESNETLTPKVGAHLGAWGELSWELTCDYEECEGSSMPFYHWSITSQEHAPTPLSSALDSQLSPLRSLGVRQLRSNFLTMVRASSYNFAPTSIPPTIGLQNCPTCWCSP
jgi:hypothetical protein